MRCCRLQLAVPYKPAHLLRSHRYQWTPQQVSRFIRHFQLQATITPVPPTAVIQQQVKPSYTDLPIVSDANACTADSCDTATGNAVYTDLPIASDNDACTVDSCDSVNGETHTQVVIDDNNACTTDSCDITTGLITHEAGIVDDNNACTVDSCNSSTGQASHILDPTLGTPETCDNIDNDCDGVIDNGNVCTDIDGDTVPNATDNCPDIANPGQEDFDQDGLGDACDPDDDNDSVVDANDQCQNTPNGTAVDTVGCSGYQSTPASSNKGGYGLRHRT